MNFTFAERQDVAIKACSEWLSTKWGQHYTEMLRYLPEKDGEEVRLMLQRAIRQAMTYRPNELVSVAEVNRQYMNLLDANKLDIHERRAEMFRAVAQEVEKAQSLAEREKAEADDIQARIDEEAAFQQGIADRAAEDAANKKIPIKELRRAALFGKDKVNGHLTTMPMPASVKHL